VQPRFIEVISLSAKVNSGKQEGQVAIVAQTNNAKLRHEWLLKFLDWELKEYYTTQPLMTLTVSRYCSPIKTTDCHTPVETQT